MNSPIGPVQDSGMRRLKAGLIYFLLIFALGWVLGPIRELWAVPRFGRITALLCEAVIMVIAMLLTTTRNTRTLAINAGCGWDDTHWQRQSVSP